MQESIEELRIRSKNDPPSRSLSIPIADALFVAFLRRSTIPFVPELIEKISKTDLPLADVITPSLSITGSYKGRGGERQTEVLYVHDYSYLSNPRHILRAARDSFKGALRFPQDDFDSLLDRVDNETVFRENLSKLVQSRQKMRKGDSSSHLGNFSVNVNCNNLEEDFQTIPFFASRENAEIYMKKIERDSYQSSFIGSRARFPLARFLCINFGSQCTIGNLDNFERSGKIYMLRRAGTLSVEGQ